MLAQRGGVARSHTSSMLPRAALPWASSRIAAASQKGVSGNAPLRFAAARFLCPVFECRPPLASKMKNAGRRGREGRPHPGKLAPVPPRRGWGAVWSARRAPLFASSRGLAHPHRQKPRPTDRGDRSAGRVSPRQRYSSKSRSLLLPSTYSLEKCDFSDLVRFFTL